MRKLMNINAVNVKSAADKKRKCWMQFWHKTVSNFLGHLTVQCSNEYPVAGDVSWDGLAKNEVKRTYLQLM
jgi:hypothetical protein